MKLNTTSFRLSALLLAAATVSASAQISELDQLKAAMKVMQQNMEVMQRKIAEMEAAKAATSNAVAQTSPSVQTMERIATGQTVGTANPVADRHAMNDQQEGAPRLNDYTLDPKYRGFIPVPNTPVLIKLNAKPRLDVTSDSRNSGNPDRFVTAQIPVKGQPSYGGSEQFNINARGSQLRADVRAPEMDGNFRFYYENDFFGSGGGMSYRLRHMYGQFYNLTAGYTYSCFEDPDAWPDTVDYEGPNGAVFARRPLVRYMLPFCEAWQMNFGVEAPGAEVDGNSTADSINQANRAPDCAMNVRWENSQWGHVQLGNVVRNIGARGSSVGNQDVWGWGFNLSSGLNVFQRDSLQAQLTYGEGIFRYINDDFMNNDAAYDAAGNLHALPCFAATAGYTHQWSDSFRSTLSYGFVDIDNQGPQGPDAYYQTHYASLNLVWQMRKHLSVGLEGLYGRKETQSHATGDVWRIQLGMVYSLFD